MANLHSAKPVVIVLAISAIWLCAGAILTVVVTWYLECVPWQSQPNRSIGPASAVEAHRRFAWVHRVHPEWPWNIEQGVEDNSLWSSRMHFERGSTADGCVVLNLPSAGIPFRCLGGGAGYDYGPKLSYLRYTTWGILKVRPSNPDSAELPLVPLWPGFPLNTVFYATLAWSFYQLPLALRRHHRRRTNHCTRCAYNLKGLPPDSPCPECNTPRPPLRY